MNINHETHVAPLTIRGCTQVEIVANDQGSRITPSWVAFTSDGEQLVGEAAKNQVRSQRCRETSLIRHCPHYMTTIGP